MVNIDYIMDLLDWNKKPEEQKKGVELAREVKSINVFLQPCDKRNNKNVWDNCALILSQRTDEELEPYLIELLEWLQDLNWPGVFIIIERLKHFNGEFLIKPYEKAIIIALNRPENDREWLDNLSVLTENSDLVKRLSGDLYTIIIETYTAFWNNSK